MPNFNQSLAAILKKDPRFVDQDGDLLKSAAVDAAWKADKILVAALLKNSAARQKFFDPIGDALIFNITRFVDFIQDKNFLSDSWTKYCNQIGFDFGGKFLRERGEVALVWPYKDCVLEAGMTDEEASRREIFFNEILAEDEIARLFDPKVLTGWKKFSQKGAEKVAEIRRDADGTIRENFIVKGNNLLALHSLKAQFAGKVKLIYIDPPYNTGNDGFRYNDNFNHSTWLTFMRNRLEVAREFLREDGVIFVSCDDNEQAYLKVLMDELFGRENFVADFIWNHRKSSQNDIDVSLSHNYTLAFAKNRENFRLNPLAIDESKFSNPDNDPRGDWVADPFDAPNIRENLTYAIKNPNTGEEFFPPEGRHWRMSKSKFQEALKDNRIIFGKTGKTKPQLKRFKSEAEEKGTNPFTIWDDVGTSTEGTKELQKLEFGGLFSSPKPERLLQRIIELSTKEGDTVLDFFSGSGTTGAVAHKMKRQYILIEQMNYIHDLPEARLRKVIDGEQGGISKAVGWTGGGDFIYCELAKWNENFVEKIRDARDTDALLKIWEEMKDPSKSFLDYNVDLQEQDNSLDKFRELSLEKQKKSLILLLDKNELYVNLSEIEDEDYAISPADKKLNGEFYEI